MRLKAGGALRNFSPEYELELKVLEECSIDDKIIRECHYYDTLSPFYGRRAAINTETHREKCREWEQKYRENNRDVLKKKSLDRYYRNKET